MSSRDSNAKALAAMRERALARPELRGPTEPRAHNATSGPTSRAAKLKDPAIIAMIDAAVAGKRVQPQEEIKVSEPKQSPPLQPRPLKAAGEMLPTLAEFQRTLATETEYRLFAALCIALGGLKAAELGYPAGAREVGAIVCGLAGVQNPYRP